MALFTSEQQKILLANGLLGIDSWPVLRLFIPGTGIAWLISEIDPESQDCAFGLCDTGDDLPELRYISFAEFYYFQQNKRVPIEQDKSFEAKYPMNIYERAGFLYGRIVTDDQVLAEVEQKHSIWLSQKNLYTPSV